jgi:hypothetical protein
MKHASNQSIRSFSVRFPPTSRHYEVMQPWLTRKKWFQERSGVIISLENHYYGLSTFYHRPFHASERDPLTSVRQSFQVSVELYACG